MPESSTTIVWFRRDLRLSDHPALGAAALRGTVIPVFIWSPEEEGRWAPGAASRWWLHHSLASLQTGLAKHGLKLIIRRGSSLEVLRDLVADTGATAVCWNRLYEPEIIARDTAIKKMLRDDLGIDVRSYNGSLLREPWEISTKTERPYQVFTPYYRACQAAGAPAKLLPVPKLHPHAGKKVRSESLASLQLLPGVDWAGGFREAWTPGESGARAMLKRFASAVAAYHTERDRPDHEGTSRLSPHLHFGEISPREVWKRTESAAGSQAGPYLRQLVWRDFAHQLLYHFPRTDWHPLRTEFNDFAWARDDAALVAWQQGRTGFPIVDAGMRQLWKTGWMHNRVRMIVASFLVKDLMIPWQRGAEWFWDTLVDADLANNSMGWQWCAGCGADAAPYFRVFNPASQAAKFDPRGDYIRRWLPEIKSWPVEWLHDSALADPAARKATGYPARLVDHAKARDRALAAYRELRARGL